MIHLRIGTNGANDQYRSLCGWHNTTSSENPPFVTCKDCLERMKELGIEIKPAPWDYKWIINTKRKTK